MTLRKKSLLTIGLALVVLIASLYLVSKSVMLASFADLEARDTRQNVQRVLNALEEELSALNEKSTDWAVWDDSYQFIEDGNPEYIKSNLGDRTFADLRLNLMLFVNSSDEVVFGKGFDLEKGEEVPVPEELLLQIASDGVLLRHTDPESSIKGILMLPEGPMILSSRPIVTSDGGGPIRGTLLTGRYLGSEQLRRLADRTRLSLSLYRVGDPQMPADFRAMADRLSKDPAIAVQPLDGDKVAGYALVADLYGEPALVLRAEIPRAIYQQGQSSLTFLVALLLGVGLIFGLITMLLLERTVLSRVARLSAEVREIGVKGDLSARVPASGADELASLASTTNGMLEAVENAQRELRASEDRYRAFVERSSDAIWRMELEEPLSLSLPEEEQIQHLFRHVYLAECNDEMARVCGFDRAEQALGMRLSSLLDPAAPGSLEFLRSFVRSGYRLTNVETDGLSSQASSRHYLASQVGMVEAGVLLRAWGSLRDITERKEAEEALRESRQQVVRILEILESITDPFVAVDAEWRLTYMNPKAEELLSGSSDQLLGKPVWDRIPEPLSRRLREECGRAAADRSAVQFEGFHPALQRWFSVHAYPHQCGVSMYLRDITERKQLEEQLLRAQRLETAGRIAGQVAHDFNNLLGPLTAYPELIKMQLPEGHSAGQYCDDMLEAAERMAYINEEMMTLGRRGNFAQQPTDLNHVVRQAVDELADRPVTLEIQVELAEDLLPVSASPAQLMRVVTNLVSNAKDAMQGAGTVTISTQNVTIGESDRRNGRLPAGDYALVSVGDTGCGIPPEIQDRIFEAFFTTKDKTQRRGCGLGLSIVQAIVEDHKGFLELESQPGKGTIFRIYLPASREAMKQKDSGGVVGGHERVLVVDDDRLQREVARQLLETLGYQVEVAASGEEAINCLKTHPADLMVLDMVLESEVGGTEIYRRALEVSPGQRAILLSGFSESEQVRQARELGAGAYLRKPVTLEKLAKAVREELDRRN